MQSTPTPPSPRDREYLKALNQMFAKFALEDQRKYYERTSTRYRKAAAQVNVMRAFFAFLTGFASALAGIIVAAYLVPGSFANNGACATLDVIETVAGANQTILSSTPMPGVTATPAAEATVDPNYNLTEQQVASTQAAVDTGYCINLKIVVGILMVTAVVAPALGAASTTLADLFQWDRMTAIYDAALENIEVADAQSPYDDMDDLTYRAALRAMVEGTLTVMSDETAQWGQSVRTPVQLDKFVDEEREKLERRSGGASSQQSNGGNQTETPG